VRGPPDLGPWVGAGPSECGLADLEAWGQVGEITRTGLRRSRPWEFWSP